MPGGEHERIDILGVKVSAVTPALACEAIDGWITRREKVYVCVAPASTLVACREDAAYRDVVNGAAMVTPDGMPLVWLGKAKGNRVIRRTYGPDLMLAVCNAGHKKGYRHYFYGATQETCDRLAQNLKERFPGLVIVGSYAPPFRPQACPEDPGVIEAINRAKPDVLWVAIGSPKQDFWMRMHRDRLDAPVIVGIGAAFDFLSGAKRQAPRWMRASGLEWFFRLCCEPGRLWKRYLVGNSKFVFYVLQEQLRG